MLEFHISVFDKLYRAAVIMNITVLTKLLDAQRKPHQVKAHKRKLDEVTSPSIKSTPRTSSTTDLPATLPGRKVPVWKRKAAPVSHQSGNSDCQDKWSSDPLMVHDTKPKPTRFEWPDEELPPLALMDSTFEEISYTSKPLLTQEEETRAISHAASTSSSMEDTRQMSPTHNKKSTVKTIIVEREGKNITKSESSNFEESKYFTAVIYHLVFKL